METVVSLRIQARTSQDLQSALALLEIKTQIQAFQDLLEYEKYKFMTFDIDHHFTFILFMNVSISLDLSSKFSCMIYVLSRYLR